MTCNQTKSPLHSLKRYNGNDTWCQHPCTTWTTWGCCSQAWRGPPRSCHTHQNTDGLLWDDQWWTQRAWAVPTYCLCLSPSRKAPQQTYSQIFQNSSSKLTDISVNHFSIQHTQEQVSHSSKPVGAICHDKCQGACTSHDGDGHTPPALSRDCPNCT